MSPRNLSPERPLRRRGPRRDPKSRFLIITEGEVTEQDYLRHLRRVLRGTLVELDIASDNGDPLIKVNRAIQRRQEAARQARQTRDPYLSFDQVWCLLDVDTHERLPEALKLAQAEGIQIALSGPCFELWPLLHFRDQSAHLDAKEAVKMLREFLPGYQKKLDCSMLSGRYDDARRRAGVLQKTHDRNAVEAAGRNPSTDVWKLVDALLLAADSNRPAAL